MLTFSSSPDDIGCESDAARAVADDLPYLDHGLFKRVYRDDTFSTVYKVVRPGNGGEAAIGKGRRLNLLAEAAWSAYGIARGVPGIPPVTLYIVEGVTVLAMPFFPEAADWAHHDEIDAWHDMGLEDLHDGNWRLDAQGNAWVIDLGGWANGFPADAVPSHVITAVESTTAPDVDDVHDDYCDCDECCGDRCGCGDGCTAGNCQACDDDDDRACGLGRKVPATGYDQGIWVYCERDEDHTGTHKGWDWAHVTEIEWDTTAVPAMCNAVSPDLWVCSLDEGHVGDHEAWGARVPNVHDEPFDVWPNANPVMPGDPKMGDGCQETANGLICCLDLWHKGRHEAWGVESLLLTWGRDVDREHAVMEDIGIYEPENAFRCGTYKGGLMCTVRRGHAGPHVAHHFGTPHSEIERWYIA